MAPVTRCAYRLCSESETEYAIQPWRMMQMLSIPFYGTPTKHNFATTATHEQLGGHPAATPPTSKKRGAIFDNGRENVVPHNTSVRPSPIFRSYQPWNLTKAWHCLRCCCCRCRRPLSRPPTPLLGKQQRERQRCPVLASPRQARSALVFSLCCSGAREGRRGWGTKDSPGSVFAAVSNINKCRCSSSAPRASFAQWRARPLCLAYLSVSLRLCLYLGLPPFLKSRSRVYVQPTYRRRWMAHLYAKAFDTHFFLRRAGRSWHC